MDISYKKLRKVTSVREPLIKKCEANLDILIKEIHRTCPHKNSWSYNTSIGRYKNCYDCLGVFND